MVVLPALAPGTAAGSGGSVINARGLDRDRHRAARRGGLEVHDRRLDPGGRDPDDRRALRAAIGRHYDRRARGHRRAAGGLEAEAAHAQRRRAGRRREPGRRSRRSRTPGRSPPTGSSPCQWSATRAEQERIAEAVGRARDPGRAAHPSTRRTASSPGPVLDYLDELDSESPDDIITVVIPEFVVTHWYTQRASTTRAPGAQGPAPVPAKYRR